MNKQPTNKLAKQIKNLPCFQCVDDRLINVTPIEMGLSSQCFSVSIKQTTYFVKFNTDVNFFKNERNATQIAATATLSPAILYSQGHWLVSHFIEGESLNRQKLPLKSKIQTALALMATCHELPLTFPSTLSTTLPLAVSSTLPELNLPNVILTTMNASCFTVSEKTLINTVLKKLPKINTHLPVFCHGDVNFSNIIASPDKAWLIDFECACSADKEFDLAMFFAINTLTNTEQHFAVKCYEKLKPQANINQQKLQIYLHYAYLLNGVWYLHRMKQSIGTPQNTEQLYLLAQAQFVLFDSLQGTKFLSKHLLD